jgi:EAL domain-containing protein (putative c-di-GMP-specific phosphodiesterase class I)
MIHSSPRILLLDDEPFVLGLLAHMLAGLGHTTVTTCTDGVAALAAVAVPVNAPNLILLDLNMPNMDGIEFVRRLVEQHYRGSLVLVSGEDERMLQMVERLVLAHHIPVLGHLNKPVGLPALTALLATWQPAKPVQAALRRSYGIDELADAMAQGNLVNFYQPKVALADSRVVGVESLARWHHARDGLVLPEHFIGLAERHGLIDELTRCVLTAALAQLAAWQGAGLKLTMAVNVSMRNLATVGFVDFVVDAAHSAGIRAEDLMLEVTESCLIHDQRAPLEILARLRLKRFRLSIDDFGTGHSSLTQAHDIPFDELKIDRSFVHGASHDETARAMMHASLGLGRQLGMQVVAEGVEDRADWNLVRTMGCDQAQGHFIARAMPGEMVAEWIADWHARAGITPTDVTPRPAPDQAGSF